MLIDLQFGLSDEDPRTLIYSFPEQRMAEAALQIFIAIQKTYRKKFYVTGTAYEDTPQGRRYAVTLRLAKREHAEYILKGFLTNARPGQELADGIAKILTHRARQS